MEKIINKIKTAEELSTDLRSVSISQFFERNRHLLGYDNPKKALLTVIKEAVDNSIDACEEARILPEIKVLIKKISENRFRIVVEDNGPGIIKDKIPKVFASLLYGSKFHRLRQSRGIQGIGISSAVLYSQLTTGKPSIITSKISKNKPAHYYELTINTKKNEPEIIKDMIIEWEKDQGTKIKLELEGSYQKGRQGVDEYLKQTAVVNPHLHLIYTNPEKQKLEFPRATKELPKEPKEIKPHPYGVELGILIRMLQDTEFTTLQDFLQKDFCRVSPKVAKEICEKSGIYERARPKRIARQEAENLFNAIKEVKIIAPPTDCISPIGEALILKGLKKEIEAEFYTAATRPPSVYRGFPFQIECCLCFGGNLPKDEQLRLLRFANRVPLLYQQSACAISKAVSSLNWRAYGLQKNGKNLPIGPIILVVHMASVWVPFTSESKEAIAHYPEIIKEIKLALQEVGRKLGIFIRKRKKAEFESQKKSYIEKYLPHIGIGLKEILNLKEAEEKKILEILKDTLERSREKI